MCSMVFSCLGITGFFWYFFKIHIHKEKLGKCSIIISFHAFFCFLLKENQANWLKCWTSETKMRVKISPSALRNTPRSINNTLLLYNITVIHLHLPTMLTIMVWSPLSFFKTLKNEARNSFTLLWTVAFSMCTLMRACTTTNTTSNKHVLEPKTG